MIISWHNGTTRSRPNVVAILLAVVALLIAMYNFWLCFLRPLLYRWHHGSMEGWRFISVAPVIGTLFIFASPLVAPGGDRTAAAIGAVALLVDTGGLPWFLICILRDRTFWER